MGGRPVKLSSIGCPVLAVGAKEDNIAPPACVKALMDAVSSRDKEYLELPLKDTVKEKWLYLNAARLFGLE